MLSKKTFFVSEKIVLEVTKKVLGGDSDVSCTHY